MGQTDEGGWDLESHLDLERRAVDRGGRDTQKVRCRTVKEQELRNKGPRRQNRA